MADKYWKNKTLGAVIVQEWENDQLDKVKLSKRHIHILYLREGKVSIRKGDRITKLHDDYFYVIPVNEKIEFIHHDNYTVQSISVKKKFVEQFRKNVHDSPLQLAGQERIPKTELMDFSHQLLMNSLKSNAPKSFANDLFYEFFIQLHHCERVLSFKKNTVIKLKALMKLRAKEEIDIRIISDNLFLTPFHLVKGFIHHFKLTPHAYQIRNHSTKNI